MSDTPKVGMNIYPQKTHPPSKNRVWNFLATSENCARQNVTFTQYSCLENSPTLTFSASGVHYYGHRFYKPSIGRWLSRDPMEEEGGVNLYVLADNDSIDQIDPVGLTACCGSVAYNPSTHCCNNGSVASMSRVRDVTCIQNCQQQYLVQGYSAGRIAAFGLTGYAPAAGAQWAIAGSNVKANVLGTGPSGTGGNIVRRILLNQGMKATGPNASALASGARTFGRMGQGSLFGFTAGFGMLALHTQNLAGYWGCISGCPYVNSCP